jgi:hypothetical protein
VILLYWFFARCGLQSWMLWIHICFAFSSILCTQCICIVIWKEEAFCDAVWEKTIDCTGEYKKGLREMQSAWLCQPSVGGKNVSADSYSFVPSLTHNHEIGPSPRIIGLLILPRDLLYLVIFHFLT